MRPIGDCAGLAEALAGLPCSPREGLSIKRRALTGSAAGGDMVATMHFASLGLSRKMRYKLFDFLGGRTSTRTKNPLIKSQLLYQLRSATAPPPYTGLKA